MLYIVPRYCRMTCGYVALYFGHMGAYVRDFLVRFRGIFSYSECRLRTGLGFFILFSVLVSVSLFALSLRDHYGSYERASHILSSLYVHGAALELRDRFSSDLSRGFVPRSFSRDDLVLSLSPSALSEGRVYVIMDRIGEIESFISASPGSDMVHLFGLSEDRIVGMRLGDLVETDSSFFSELGGSFFASDGGLISLRRVGSSDFLWLGFVDLSPYSGFLVIVQPEDYVFWGWFWSVLGSFIPFLIILSVIFLIYMCFRSRSIRYELVSDSLYLMTDRLERALDRGGCGLWNWDIGRGTIFWSGSMFALLGMDRGSGWVHFSYIASLQHVQDMPLDRVIESRLRSRESYIDHEFRMRHVDGSWVWLRARAELAHNAADDTPHFVGIAIDITEQKRLEHRNHQAESRVRDAIENISESFILLDSNNHLVMCNGKYRELFGLSVRQCVAGMPYSDLASQIDCVSSHRRGDGLVEIKLRDGRWFHISNHETRDGGTVSVGTDVTRLKRHSEELQEKEKQHLSTIRDLTASRRRLEEEGRKLAVVANKYDTERGRAEAANRTKSRFLANMSHELRTPLNAILGFSELMGREVFGPLGHGKYVEYLDDINKSGHYLLDVINDILDMSRIEEGRVALHAGLCDLGILIDESLRITGVHLRDEIRIERDFCNDLRIFGDARAFKQILINILSNSMKFMPSGGTISFCVRILSDEMVCCSISDTGIGIPASSLSRLGTAFEQVENQFTRSRSGSGLGLAIAKSLAELHGGSLKISSIEGEGTTVDIVFPGANGGRSQFKNKARVPDVSSDSSFAATG